MQDIIGAPQMHTVAGAGASISRFREPETLPCSMVNNLAKNTEDQCKFIMDNDCLEDEATVDYVYLVFCKIDYDLRLVAITLVIFLVIVLFLNLSAVADEFLCPSLLTVAKNLRMSDSLAGVTLLAFGNGCPDIFSSLAAASSGRPELIVGELLGAGIFCTSIVAGLIFITTEFKIARRPLLRDTSFYLLAVYLIWLYCTQGQVTFYGALAFIIIYVIYLLTALVGQAVHSRLRGEYPVVEMGPANEKNAPARGALDEEEQEASATEKEIIYRRLEELMRRRSSGLMEFKPLDGKRNHDNQNNTSSIHNNNSSIASQMDTVTTIYIGSTSDDSLPSYGRRNGREDTDRRILSRDWNNNNVIEGEPAEQEHGTRRTSLKSTASPVSEAMSDSKLSEIKLTAGTLLNDDSMALFESPTNINKRRSLAEQAANDNNSRFNLDEFDNFLAQVNPIDTVDWSRLSLITKIMALLRAPLLLLTILTVPVVDGEKPNSNWCRLLNSIHCFTIPIAVITLTRLMGPNWWFGDSMGPAGELEQFNQADEQLQRMAANLSDNLSSGGEYNNGHGSNGNDSDTVAMVGAHSSLGGQTSDLEDMLNSTYSRHLILLPGLVLALYVFLTTNAKRPPRYHSLFAYFGFIMSVLWIYKLANEIISLLKTIGIIFSMSDTAIGLGFLAWGNSLGDIVANLTLAQAGYARMALGASIGAPLLNLLLGFGLAFTISLRPGESTEIDYNDTMTLLAGTLALILVLLMASTFLAQNRSKKAFGYILIACYCLYFLLAVCLECDFL